VGCGGRLLPLIPSADHIGVSNVTATRSLLGGLFRVFFLLVAFVVVSVLSGGLASGLVMPALSASGAAVDGGVAFFDSLPSELREPPLMQTSGMYAANGRPIAYFYEENRFEIPLSKVAPIMQQAIVAIEDSRFYQHGGIDVRGVLRAAVNNEAGRGTQGASTLTQQYVKNVLLEQAIASGDRMAAQNAIVKNTARKLREMKIAVSIEQKLTKQQILERYLNIASFGEQTNGIQAASLQYFGVPADQLDLSQAAMLAGMVQEPSTYDPRLHPEAARNRRDVVLARMLQLNVITSAQYQKAHDEKLVVKGRPLPNGCANAGNYAYFCDYVLNVLDKSPAFSALGATPAERRRNLMRGGYSITTSLDPRTQDAAVRATFAAIPPTDSSGLATAAVTVEPGTGKIISMAQDRMYSVTAGRGRTSVNYNTDTAYGGSSGFQTGSSFKPFTLADWLATGHKLSDTVDATKRDFPFHNFTACGSALSDRGAAPYKPGNSEGTETGKMSVLDATVNSVNVAYVDMESQLDLCDIASTAESLGMHLAAPSSECKSKATSALPTCVPSLTLGVLNIAPLTMAAAYAGFASGGVYCEPLAITSMKKPGAGPGSEVPFKVPGSSCKRALDPGVASDVTSALEQVLQRGTAANVGPLDPWPSAGKTGTTDGPYDSWFVGYTAQRSTAVWVADPGHVASGRLDRRQLTNIDVNGQYYGTIFGASIAAPTWKQVTNAAMAGLPARNLP
jgi:membrane peptidoglycan carboxypeptidase